jgi:hypothetical protein
VKDGVLICTNVMKIWPGPKTRFQGVLFEKASPHRARRKLYELKCYEAAKRVPSANPTQWRNDLRLHGSAWRLRCSWRAEGGLGPKVSQPHDLRMRIISKRHLKGERTEVN